MVTVAWVAVSTQRATVAGSLLTTTILVSSNPNPPSLLQIRRVVARLWTPGLSAPSARWVSQGRCWPPATESVCRAWLPCMSAWVGSSLGRASSCSCTMFDCFCTFLLFVSCCACVGCLSDAVVRGLRSLDRPWTLQRTQVPQRGPPCARWTVDYAPVGAGHAIVSMQMTRE